MIRRLVNLPFKILGKAARAVQERQAEADQARAEELTAASRARGNQGNVPAVEVPDDFDAGDVSMSLQALDTLLTSNTPMLVIDVREDDGWEAGHIEGATHMHLSTLGLDLAELPALTHFVIVCEDGIDSRLAAKFLRFRGLDETWHLEGGLGTWRANGRPLAQP
ncbi:MAG: rhodanese-related sulfurtransferase [Myxococcota bacterium]|jgi:rhodanese-related sulfurtransferase